MLLINNVISRYLVNSSIGENRGNLSNFLNNEYVNIYVTWYRLYNFFLGGWDADIIDFNYKKEWNILFKNQIIFGDYSKTPFLVRSAALFTEIMPRASTRQGLLFRKYKRKLTRSVNAENAVRQVSRANATEGEDHNFFQIVNSNPIHLFLIITFYFTLLFLYYYVHIGQIIFIYYINSVFFYFFIIIKSIYVLYKNK